MPPSKAQALSTFHEFQLSENRTIGLILEVHLTADTFQDYIGVDAGPTLELLRGLKSVGGEEFGWNAIVRRGWYPIHAQRISGVQLNIRIPFFPDYEITVPETILMTVPASSVTSNQSIVASPFIRIPASAGAAEVSGPLVNSSSEERLRDGDRVDFNLTVHNETWAPGVGESDTYENRLLSETLIRGITPVGRWAAEVNGWYHIVRPALLAMQPLPLTRADDYTIQFTVPRALGYDIIAPETLQLHIHESLVLAEAPIIAQPYVAITALPGVALLTGLSVSRSVSDIHPPPPPLRRRPPPPAPSTRRAAASRARHSCRRSARAGRLQQLGARVQHVPGSCP